MPLHQVNQPVAFFELVLTSNLLVHAIGRLSVCSRFFGSRRSQGLWQQKPGLSLCEAAIRSSACRIDKHDLRALQEPPSKSAGTQLLSLAIQPGHLSPFFSSLVAAAATQGEEALRALRARGVSLNARAKQSVDTALIAAARSGRAGAVRSLAAVGARLDLLNSACDGALFVAAWRGRKAVVKALIQAGAAIDTRNKQGNTALICATFRGHLATVAALIQAKAAVDISNTLFHRPCC